MAAARRRIASQETVSIPWEIWDGDTKGRRIQYGYQCTVTATVYAGDPGCYRTPNGDGWPPTGPEVEIVSVEVHDVVVYCYPNFDQGVSLDSRDEHLPMLLASYSEWCRDRVSTDTDFDDAAIEAAGLQASERE